ncbi:MAG: Rieske 2Fe-2S domain-containing protein [Alphaproteobacteria bacterium]|nr:Rieske 2Fe-2S domain-containing protein [Alphaproteobacteria bacterium]MBV9861949.1 Rieske 2Fe-2S domain-containing protein [Alphaproteobacteria bacterium]
MLSREENELLTRVDRGTPMGNTMRMYWLPALLAKEIPEPDCPPVRVRLLGEDLVAFRDSKGRIGLLDELCPHRLASLFFGRNEECGLRCVYHGWKFDVDGSCVDQLNEPEETQFKHKVHATAYPTVELGGIVWAYLGPPERIPAPPKFAWTQVPETHRHVTKVIQECNWLQGLEGGIDTSHAPIMHRLLTENSTRGGFKPSNPFVRGKAPNLVVDITDYGYQYAGIRPLGDDEMHIRTYQFILPFHQIRPSRSERGFPLEAGHAWVPVDNETTIVYNWAYSTTEEPLNEEDRLERSLGNGPLHVDPTTFRSKANRQNNYGLDRTVQRYESYTGIDGINVQDRAIQESMGKVVDRSREHLGPADKAIIQARKLLRQAVKTAEAGGAPDGTRPTYYDLHAHEKVMPRRVDWRTEVTPEMPREAILQTV